MNIIDIIIAIPLIWALYKGFKDGIIMQLGGIAAILIGLFLAIRYGRQLGDMLHIDPALSFAAGFVIILFTVIIAVAILGFVFRGLFRLTGLGALDQLGGALLSLLKMAIALSLLLYGLDYLNRDKGWIPEEKTESSIFYTAFVDGAAIIFPVAEMIKEKIFEPEEKVPGRLEYIQEAVIRDIENILADTLPAEDTVMVEQLIPQSDD